MDNVRLLLRYAVPGWLIVVLYGVYEGGRCAAHGLGLHVGCLSPTADRPVDVLVLLTIAGLGGIPLGFVLYQTYMAIYHRMRRPFGGLDSTPYFDRGYGALWLIPYRTRLAIARELRFAHALTDEASPYDPLLFGHSYRVDSRRIRVLGRLGYRRMIEVHRRYPADPSDVSRQLEGRNPWPPAPDNHKCELEQCPTSAQNQVLRNWATASYVWFRVVTSCNLALVEERAAGYSDVFHSLGAARLSLALVPLLALGVRSYEESKQDALAEAAVIGVIALGSVLILKAFNSARRSTQHSLIDTYRNFITALAPTVFPDVPPEPVAGGTS